MRNRRMLTVTLGIVVALVFGIVVAYAALSSTLNAKFNGVTQSALSWDVGFNTRIGAGNGTEGGTSSTGRSCGSASITANSITISSTTLSKPGDSCTWVFVVENKGDIAAKVSSITANAPSGISCTKNGTTMVCGNLTYSFSGLNVDSTITNTPSVTMKVEYTGSTLNYSAVTHTNPGYTITFAQA